MEHVQGHRQRLKDRFRQEGLDNFDERHVLELLLFYCVPRQDTRDLACRLIDHFGSLVAVLDASAQELEEVSGVGEGISTFLVLRRELQRYYCIKKEAQRDTLLRTSEECGTYLAQYMKNQRNEMVYMLCLDAKCKVLACKQVGEGSVNYANVPIRRIVETALNVNATTVILAHNHPSGLALPSADDIQTTHRLAQALDAVEIVLLDHFVFTDDDFVSLVQSGYYRAGR